MRFIDPTGHIAVCSDCTPSGRRINKPDNGTKPIDNIFPKPIDGDFRTPPKLGPIIEGPSPDLNPKPKGGDIKAPTPIGPIIEIPIPNFFRSGGIKTVDSKGNPNPNVNPPGHKPGPQVPLPPIQAPKDFPPANDPQQVPPDTPEDLPSPTKDDPPSYWIIWYLTKIIIGTSDQATGGVDNPESGGQ